MGTAIPMCNVNKSIMSVCIKELYTIKCTNFKRTFAEILTNTVTYATQTPIKL